MQGRSLALSTRDLIELLQNLVNNLVMGEPIFFINDSLQVGGVLASDVHWGHDEAWDTVDF